MKMFESRKKFTILFYGLTTIFLCSLLFDFLIVHYVLKPLFMVTLMVFHRQQVKDKFGFLSRMVQFGLFFSWIGDIALMLDEHVPILFVVGLGAFLIAHVGYALGFIRTITDSGKPIKLGQSTLMALPFALFTGFFFFYIKDGIPSDLFVPVLAYTVVISFMGITSALRQGHVEQNSYKWILVGATLFILSDCVIAVNKFYYDFDYDAVLNMTLYLTGQFMITVGAVKYSNSVKNT